MKCLFEKEIADGTMRCDFGGKQHGSGKRITTRAKYLCFNGSMGAKSRAPPLFPSYKLRPVKAARQSAAPVQFGLGIYVVPQVQEPGTGNQLMTGTFGLICAQKSELQKFLRW